jgi:hypothetical protein
MVPQYWEPPELSEQLRAVLKQKARREVDVTSPDFEHRPPATSPSHNARMTAERAERLRRFRGPLEQNDAETIDDWRQASPAAHAEAMIQLARMAEMIVVTTGFAKDPNEIFPGFPPPWSATRNITGEPSP